MSEWRNKDSLLWFSTNQSHLKMYNGYIGPQGKMYKFRLLNREMSTFLSAYYFRLAASTSRDRRQTEICTLL